MTWKNLTVERGVVTLLMVNRPDQRNAIDFSTMDELEEVLTILERDESLRALVLTGGGDTFVSGGDLKDFLVLVTAEDGQRMARRMGNILSRVSRLPVPVIAALNGPAVGGGTEVALACDLRVAATNAYFSFRQVTMGIMTAWGGAPRLLALLGFSRSLYYLLTAERITPEQALQLGLVQRAHRRQQRVRHVHPMQFPRQGERAVDDRRHRHPHLVLVHRLGGNRLLDQDDIPAVGVGGAERHHHVVRADPGQPGPTGEVRPAAPARRGVPSRACRQGRVSGSVSCDAPAPGAPTVCSSSATE